MMTLVIGGSKCGKSGYAESLFADFRGEKIYLATMRPFGDEAHMAIERHRKARSGKGFFTLERFTDIGCIELSDGCGVLLEDMGNLCANEMFSDEKIIDPTEKILCGIEKIRRAAALFVIVSNNVCADGIDYPEGTALYMRYLAEINNRIAELSDSVAECVYGIPISVPPLWERGEERRGGSAPAPPPLRGFAPKNPVL